VVTPPTVTVISGAASGIGRATAVRLAARGDHVALLDMDAGKLESTASSILEAGGRAESWQVDVRDRPAIERVCAGVVDRLGTITYVFSNAGITGRQPVSAMTLAEWNAVVDTHLTGSFHLCQVALAHMVRQKRGAVVLTSSDYAVAGMPDQAHYAAAKTALYSLTKALALELAPHGIRINAVGPGPIDTPLLRAGRTAAEWEERLRVLHARIPMGRLGRPEEVASVVEFFLSDRASYITGQLIQPNGGQVLW
jgi:NAD(P)-dependent dehydrogenase (short-subunit alcohol dehydrogenase family)